MRWLILLNITTIIGRSSWYFNIMAFLCTMFCLFSREARFYLMAPTITKPVSYTFYFEGSFESHYLFYFFLLTRRFTITSDKWGSPNHSRNANVRERCLQNLYHSIDGAHFKHLLKWEYSNYFFFWLCYWYLHLVFIKKYSINFDIF